MKLTEHFSLEEFERSTTAIRLGIDNSIPAPAIDKIKNLCQQVLEPLRMKVNEPVIITSGYRCPALNKIVGGSITSQHLKGEACDIYLSDLLKLKQWFTLLMDGEFDQLILERASKTSSHYWIHVSCQSDISKNRHQVIRLTKS